MSETQAQPSPRRLAHFTPLRYPGGKAKLAPYVKDLIASNNLYDGMYVEPYCGGAGIALELLLHEYVSRIHINDVSDLVYSFWFSVLNKTDELCRLIVDTPRSIESWDRQKYILMHPDEFEILSVGFATFFLNRTNRSGILNAGIIGGRDQMGPWKIGARYNACELVGRIEAIAKLKENISLSRLDALELLEKGASSWPEKTLIYLDPPYYAKGRDLYYDFYNHDDHVAVARLIQSALLRQKWIVSYDNVGAIREMYSCRRSVVYGIGYSARQAKTGSEVMFFSDGLEIPALRGAIIAEGGGAVSAA